MTLNDKIEEVMREWGDCSHPASPAIIREAAERYASYQVKADRERIKALIDPYLVKLKDQHKELHEIKDSPLSEAMVLGEIVAMEQALSIINDMK